MPQLGDILVKIANNEALSVPERDFLRLEGNRTQNVNALTEGFTKLGQTTLNLKLPFEVIYSETLTADLASVTVNIPANYKHLIMQMGGQTDNAAYQDVIVIRFNGDSGANYLNQGVEGTGINVTGQANIITSGIDGGNFAGTSSNASGLSGSTIFIPHYGAGLWKAVYRVSGGAQRDATNPGVNLGSGFWKSASKIQYLTFSPLAGTVLKANSAFSVYGIL